MYIRWFINFLYFLILIGLGFFIFVSLHDDKKAEITVDQNFHTSMYYYGNSDFFTESTQSFKDFKPLSLPPRIFIVNQHVLASHVIAKQFAVSADKNVKTVILITQNNWNAGQASIITSKYGWKTPLGTILPATELINSLIDKELIVDDEDIFLNEHGITGIVPYVANSFPNAKIIPIVIRDKTYDELIDNLATELSKVNLDDTVIVGSIDMSHYLPKYLADAHDRLTVQSIKNFDYDILPRLDIDTAPTLRTVLKVAENFKQKEFVQTGGVNSAEIVGDLDLLETTSYISGYFKGGAGKEGDDNIHILFVGDIMLDRGVSLHAKKHGIDTLFSGVERLFLGTNMVVGNLEGTITDNQSISEKDPSMLKFTFASTFAELLKKLNFTTLSLANNHALDFGGDGYRQTEYYLGDVGIKYFGSPINDYNLSVNTFIYGKTICFVGYHDLFTFNQESVIGEIKKIKNSCNYVILLTHWGIEYSKTPSDRQRELAHGFIDAGADLIIGSHPHVVQPVEIYNNKAIFYSLGNFIFDQDFSFETRHGLAVNVEFDNDKIHFVLVPTFSNRAEVEITNIKDGEKTLQSLIDNGLSADVASDIINKKEFTLWNQN